MTYRLVRGGHAGKLAAGLGVYLEDCVRAYELFVPWVTRKGQDPCLNCRHTRSSGARGALPSFTHSVPLPWLCSRVDALILGTTETNYRGILLLKSNTSLEMKVHHSPGLCWGLPS